MKNKWRRFEVLFPERFNDGRAVPRSWLGEAIFEIANYFGAVSHETQKIKGIWRHQGTTYREKLTRIVVDLPDIPKNRLWMKQYKKKWKARLQQIELWMVSYSIKVE
jgi:hypothetical protein